MRKLIDPAKAAAVDRIVENSKPIRKELSSEPIAADISLDDLIGKSLLILYRETRALLEESSAGKLSKDSAVCVRDNLKLLKELKEKEKSVLDNLTDEELEKLVGQNR